MSVPRINRQAAVDIFHAAVAAAHPVALMREAMRWDEECIHVRGMAGKTEDKFVRVSDYSQVVLCAVGKASVAMAEECMRICADVFHDGLIVAKEPTVNAVGSIPVVAGGHPVPTAESIDAGKRLYNIAHAADEHTLMVNCISGGASALVDLPYRDERYQAHAQDIQAITDALLRCTATIEEINCVRKHCSLLKGGRFIAAAFPATTINLIISDVIGDDISVIASGLTAADNSTFDDAIAILRRYKVWGELGEGVRALLEAGAAGKIAETPDEHANIFTHTHNFLIGSNARALYAAYTAAQENKYACRIVNDALIGEAREAALFLAGVAHYERGRRADCPLCLLCGGETTVTIHGDGMGGRNQELALAFCEQLAHGILADDAHHILLLSVATDGNDGPTDAAGAFADYAARESAAQQRLSVADYMDRNDSYRFHTLAGSLYKSGLTGTNVGDLQIILIS